MERYVIELKDKRKKRELLKLLNGLDYIRLLEVYKDAKKARFASDLIHSLREIEASERGEVKLQSAKDMLRELRG